MKKLLVTLMCVAMILALMPAVAFAGIDPVAEAGTVAKIGDDEYTSLSNAISAVPDGQTTTIKILDNINLDAFAIIPAGKKIVIDLNGNKIQKSNYVFLNKGELTITDTSAKKNGTIHADEQAAIWAYDKSETTIENGIIEGLYGIVVVGKSTLTVNDGIIKSIKKGGAAVSGLGNEVDWGTSININGGSLISTESGSCALYHPQVGDLTISGNVALSGDTAIEMRAGNLTVKADAEGNAPTMTATGEFSIKPNGNGSTTNGVAVVASQHTTDKPINVHIAGGTFIASGENGKSLYIKDIQNEFQHEAVSVNITGGIFKNDVTKATTNSKLEIKGGTFVADVKDYVATGYETVKKDGKFVVGQHSLAKVAKVAATCAKAGVEEHYKCEFCGKLYSDVAGTTVVTPENLVIAATGKHTYGDWTTVTAPTCVDKGLEKHVCSVCEKEEKRDVAATGKHIFKDGKCSVCSAVDPNAPTHTPIDTTKPVEDVTVGVAKDDVKEVEKVANNEANAIVEVVKAGKADELKKNDIVDKKVIDAIANAPAGSDVKVTTNVTAKLVEKSAVSEEAVALVVKGADNSTVAQYLDLSVMMNVVVDGTVVETGEIKQLSKPITFTIAVPEELKTVKEGVTRTYYVIRVHGNEVTKIPTTVNADGTLSFETDRFSTYALAYTDTAKATTPTKDTPKTGDATNMLPWLALMAVAGAGAVVFKRKED